MTSAGAPRHRIELHLRELAQLFNSMDPTPFHHKDLDPAAKEFIESWALEFPPDSRFEISLHLDKPPPEGDATVLVAEAISNYFAYEAELVRRDVRRLLQEGRIALLIGLTFLASCLLLADTLATFAARGTFTTIFRESLTIGGWVALWRPLEIFLYDWWPLVRRRRIYRNLARAHVRVTTGG